MQSVDAVEDPRVDQTEGVLRYFPTTTPPPLGKTRHLIIGQQEQREEHRYCDWGILHEGGTEIID